MGKKKSLKIILISAVSLVCVAAIVLGCVFGLRKKDDNLPGGNSAKFTTAQKALADEINAGNLKMDYSVYDAVPYSQVCTYDKITMLGKNYFAYKKSVNQEEFYSYKINSDGTVELNHLTDAAKNFIVPGALSYKVSAIKEDYVVLKSVRAESNEVNLFSDEVYTMIYFGGETPVEVFRFDTAGRDIWVPTPTGVIFKENYFAFSYVSNCDIENGVGDCEIKYYTYPKENVTSSVYTLSTKYYDETKSGKISRLETFNNMFVSQYDDIVKIVYLKDGNFETIEKTIEKHSTSGALLYTYEVEELTNDKFVITKIQTVQDASNVKETSVLVDSNAQGGSYVDYSYFLYDYSGEVATETTFPMEKGYTILEVPERDDDLTDSFYVGFKKVKDNKIQGNTLVVYFNKDVKKVVSFTAASLEKIVKAGKNSFVTANQILKSTEKTKVNQFFEFKESTYTNESKKSSFYTDYIVVSKIIDNNERFGLMTLDGSVVLKPEESTFNRIYDVSGDICIVKDINSKYYKYNILTKEKSLIDGFKYDDVINSKNLGLFIVEDDDSISLKNLNSSFVANDIVDIVGDKDNATTVRGSVYFELVYNDSTKLLVYSSKNKDISNDYTTFKAPASGGLEFKPETVNDTYGSSSITLTDGSTTFGTGSFSQSKNPTMYLNMQSSFFCADVDIELKFYNKYTLGLSGLSWIPAESSNYSVSYSYSGDLVTAPYAYMSSYNIVYYCQFSYTNVFGYGGTGFENATGTMAQAIWYLFACYLPTGQSFGSTTNQVNTYTEAPAVAATYISNGSVNASLPTSVNSVKYGHLTGWRMFGYKDSEGTSHFRNYFDPAAYQNNNTVSGVSDTFCYTYSPGHNRDWKVVYALYTFTFAEYAVNTYTLKVDSSSKSYSVLANSNVYNYVSDKTGYTWGGWTVTGADADETHKVYHVNSSGTVVKTDTYTGDTFTIPKVSGATGIYVYGMEEGHGTTTTLTSIWNPVVYTLTLDKNGATTAGTTAIYLHYGIGYYLDSARTKSMTTSANAITKPTWEGHTFQGYKLSTTNVLQSTGYIVSNLSKTLVSKNSTITASWTTNTYKVTYYTSATATTTVTVYYGNVVNIPAVSKSFYTFNGYSVSGCDTCTHYYGKTSTTVTSTKTTASFNVSSGYYYFKNLSATQDDEITVTPRWVGNSYTVTLDANGGYMTPDMLAEDSVTAGGTLLCTLNGRKYYKAYDGLAYCVLAHIYSEISGIYYSAPMLVSTDPRAVAYWTDYAGSGTILTYYKTMVYAGQTFYVSSGDHWMQGDYDNTNGYLRYDWYGQQDETYDVVAADFLDGYVTARQTHTISCNYGTAKSLVVPIRQGYTFNGWTVSNMDTVTTHIFYTSSTNTSCTTSSTDISNAYTSFTNLRGSSGTVTFTAKWTANTYNISYSLGSGKWGGSETHPATATYDVVLKVDNVLQTGWPLGYYFNGWTITGIDGTWNYGTSSSVSSSSTDISKSLGSSYKYFKNLSYINGDTVTFTARWAAYQYKIQYIENGENVTLSTSSASTAKYDANFKAYNPSRFGYTFTGWALTNLSDDITHTANGTNFTSVNGMYTDPTNPNNFILIKHASNNYSTFKNLHYVNDATVTMTANWTPNSYTITYHYANDSSFSSAPNITAVNTVTNMNKTKTQTVVFDQYFLTYAVAATEVNTTTVTVPTGYRMVGWFLKTSAVTSGAITAQDQSLVVASDSEYLFNKTFSVAHGATSAASSMHAYAVYENITMRIIWCGPKSAAEGGVVNDFSTYKQICYNEGNYGGTLAIPTTLPGCDGYSFDYYLISTNYYVAGQAFNSETSFVYNSKTYTTLAGESVPFGISNMKALDPNQPVFFAYGVSDSDTYLRKLTFTYTSSGYTVKAANKSIFGSVTIPKTYNDGVHGTMNVVGIPSSGFSDCNGITNVLCYADLTQGIGSSAFAGCKSLKTFDLAGSTTSVGTYAFNGCTALTTAKFKSATEFSTYIFYGCSALTYVYIPSNTIKVGSYIVWSAKSAVIYCGRSGVASDWSTYWNNRSTTANDKATVYWNRSY